MCVECWLQPREWLTFYSRSHSLNFRSINDIPHLYLLLAFTVCRSAKRKFKARTFYFFLMLNTSIAAYWIFIMAYLQINSVSNPVCWRFRELPFLFLVADRNVIGWTVGRLGPFGLIVFPLISQICLHCICNLILGILAYHSFQVDKLTLWEHGNSDKVECVSSARTVIRVQYNCCVCLFSFFFGVIRTVDVVVSWMFQWEAFIRHVNTLVSWMFCLPIDKKYSGKDRCNC